jgi:hypothetical protein
MTAVEEKMNGLTVTDGKECVVGELLLKHAMSWTTLVLQPAFLRCCNANSFIVSVWSCFS